MLMVTRPRSSVFADRRKERTIASAREQRIHSYETRATHVCEKAHTCRACATSSTRTTHTRSTPRPLTIYMHVRCAYALRVDSYDRANAHSPDSGEKTKTAANKPWKDATNNNHLLIFINFVINQFYVVLKCKIIFCKIINYNISSLEFY